MFPNHPLFVDKLLQTKQDDIVRELPDPTTYAFQKTDRFSSRLRASTKIWLPIGALLALAWWFSVLH